MIDGIQWEILERVRAHLQTKLIDEVDPEDPARPGYIGIGQMQGEPMDPDEARISITLHENDLDDFEEQDPRGIEWYSHDETDWDQEIGGDAWTMIRRFSVKIRSLFDSTQESRDDARRYTSSVLTKIQQQLRKVDYAGISVDGEYVSLPYYRIESEMGQFGGPDAYDFYSKVRFSLKTTQFTGA